MKRSPTVEWLTPSQAAAAFVNPRTGEPVSVRMIYRYIRHKTNPLRVTRIAGRPLIDPADLKRYQPDAPGKRARNKENTKCKS